MKSLRVIFPFALILCVLITPPSHSSNHQPESSTDNGESPWTEYTVYVYSGAKWLEGTYRDESGILYGWYRNEYLLRGLETDRARNNISYEEYETQLKQIERHLDLLAMVSYDNGQTWQDLGVVMKAAPPEYLAQYDKWHQPSPLISSVKIFYKRFQLENDLAQGALTKADYEERKQRLFEEEINLVRQFPLTDVEMQQYYDLASRFPVELARLEKAVETRRHLDSILAPWASIFVALILAASTTYFSWKRVKLERKDIELKDYQISELKLKIAQLEQQLAPKQGGLFDSLHSIFKNVS